MFVKMEAGVYARNHYIGDKVSGSKVQWLTNNAVYEVYQDEAPFQSSASPIGIFRPEMNALGQMADGEAFQGLPTAGLLDNTHRNGDDTCNGVYGRENSGN